jgi:hypothetical protein
MDSVLIVILAAAVCVALPARASARADFGAPHKVPGVGTNQNYS